MSQFLLNRPFKIGAMIDLTRIEGTNTFLPVDKNNAVVVDYVNPLTPYHDHGEYAWQVRQNEDGNSYEYNPHHGGWVLLGRTLRPNRKPECKHQWTTYQGFTETYDYCIVCDEKREYLNA